MYHACVLTLFDSYPGVCLNIQVIISVSAIFVQGSAVQFVSFVVVCNSIVTAITWIS